MDRWSEATCCWLARQEVFQVNCIQRLLAVQSSDPELLKSIVEAPWDPTLGREAHLFWTTKHSQRQNPLVQKRNCLHEFPNKKNQEPLRDDSTRRRVTTVRMFLWLYRLQRSPRGTSGEAVQTGMCKRTLYSETTKQSCFLSIQWHWAVTARWWRQRWKVWKKNWERGIEDRRVRMRNDVRE